MKAKEILNNSHLSNPAGSNELSPIGTFYWRGLYKSFIYPDNIEKPIDMWYEDVQFGRINNSGDAIYPSEKSLKQIKTDDEDTVLAINFVADAWNDFKLYIDIAVSSGKLVPEGSLYGTFDAKAGWIGVHSLYHEWNSVMYDVFSGSFMNSLRDQKIVNLKGFIDVYIEFVNRMSGNFIQTRKNWLTSRWCPSLCSGLIIEIEKAPHGEDEIKGKFIEDRNFHYISQAARKFGFKIDKNAPWRFVADLNSDKMKSYMTKYDLKNKKEVYDKLFYKSSDYELNVFKHYIWGWYNEYVTANPMTNEIKSRKSCAPTTSILREREQLTEKEAFEKYSDQFWTRLFIYVCAKEEHKKWNQATFDKVVKRTLEFWRIKDYTVAMKYLHKELKKDSKNHFSLKKDLTKEQLNAIIKDNSIKSHKDSFLF